MACVDADGIFLTVDVGDYGRNSDGRVFRRSSIGKAIENDLLDVPDLWVKAFTWMGCPRSFSAFFCSR